MASVRDIRGPGRHVRHELRPLAAQMPSARRRRFMYSSLNGASLSAAPSTCRLLIGETHRHTRPMDLRVYQPASPPSWVAHLGSTLAIPYSPPTRANARTSPLRRTALVVATTSGYLHAPARTPRAGSSWTRAFFAEVHSCDRTSYSAACRRVSSRSATAGGTMAYQSNLRARFCWAASSSSGRG